MSNWKLAVIAGFFALLALGASIAVPFWVLNTEANHIGNLEVPLLALSGFMGVFSCVALLVLAFKAMGLVDLNQALGMPEGSVRALIALLLIVTLGITAVFLLSPKQEVKPTEPTNQEAKPSPQPKQEQKPLQAPQGTEGAPAATTSAAPPSFRLAANVSPAQNKRQPGSEPPNNQSDNTGAESNTTKQGTTEDNGDLSKQFLTLVGGLVTTVVGFYFGSQTASSASAKGAKAATAAATTAATEAIKAAKSQ